MSKFEFTRFLYLKDEVILSFVISLLEKKNLHECYFWLSEIYYSKYDIDNLLFKIYYDFYFVKNKLFKNYLDKKISLGKKNSFQKSIPFYTAIVKNMFLLDPDIHVFLNRQKGLAISHRDSIEKTNYKAPVFKGRKPNFLDNIDPKFTTIFRLLHKKMIGDIYIEICSIFNCDNNKNMFKDLLDAFTLYRKNISCFIDCSDYNDFQHSYDYKHRLLAYLVDFNIKLNSDKKENSEKKKKLYVLPTDYEIEQLKNTDISLPPREFVDSKGNKHLINDVRKTLPSKRHFSVHKDLLCFNFVRKYMDTKEVCDKYYYNWEYYASTCERWRERMENYNVTFKEKYSKENKEFNFICFQDDDTLEDFYEHYGYEPDEQSRETCKKSFSDVYGVEYSVNKLLKNLFNYTGDYDKELLF